MATSGLALCAPPLVCLAASRPLSGVPVFVYHGLGECGPAGMPARERKYWVGEEQFRAQLRAIAESGYEGVLLDGRQVRRRAAALTFDDGHASDYEIALPALEAAGLRATFFINTATVGSGRRLTWAQVRDMAARGMSIQSHAHQHVRLTRLSGDVLWEQLRRSKLLIEDRVGVPVDYLAAPFGDVNRRVREAAKAAGYLAVCTGRSWPAQPGQNVIPRVAVYAHTPVREFRMLLEGAPEVYIRRATRAALLYFPKLALSYLSPH